jgi:uncharacterized protein (TIGR02099 family)
VTRALRILLRRLTALAAVVIIALAVLTLTLRLTLPHADELRGVVTEALGDYLGADVTVVQLGLHLHGLQPELALNDAVLRDPATGETLLALQTLRVDLDLSASLFAGAPRIDGVTLVGAHIDVRRGADGRIGVRGLDQLDGGDGDAAAFFLREGHFSLARSEVSWTDAGVPPLELRVKRLDLINRGKRHWLGLDAAPSGDAAGELTLRADLSGPARRPDSWSGRIYADWRGNDLARLLRGRLPADYGFATHGVHITTWNHLAGGRLNRSVTRLRLDDLVLRRGATVPRSDAAGGADVAATQPEEMHLGDTGALLRWERQADGWRLDVPELRLFGNLLGEEETGLWLRGGPTAASAGPPGHYVETWVGNLPLTRLAEAASFAAPADLPQVLRGLLDGRIAGQLQDLRLRLDLPATNDEGPTHGNAARAWLVQGRIRGFGIGPAPGGDATPAPSGPIPPLDGVNLSFAAAPDRGTVDVHGADAYLDLRPHTIAPFRLTRLVGRLQWRVQPDRTITLWTRALAADTPDVTTLSRLLLRTAPGQSPYIDLHSHIRGGDADAMPRYLPASQMSQELQDWLDQAVVAGNITSGDLLLRGPLADFPFDAGNGWFRLELRIRDGVLDYQPQIQPQALQGTADGPVLSSAETAGTPPPASWPPLEDMDLNLRFDRRSLDIDLASARILDTAVTSGHARIPNLWQPDAIAIRAAGDGPLTDGLAFLADTPLATSVGGIPKALSATGRGHLSLRLDVPLRPGLKFGYAGKLDFGDAAVVGLRDGDLRLTDIDGGLSFDNQGLTARGIRARLGQQQLSVDIATEQADAAGDGGRTDITASGATAIDTLAAALPSPWWALAGGRADWQLRVSLDNDDAVATNPPLELLLTSSLKGVTIDLPAPFGKSADATRDLSIGTRLVPDQPLQGTARLGDIGARLELAQRGGELAPSRAAVDLNRLPEALPDAPGIQVQGQLGTVDLAQWLDWGRAHPALLPDAGGAEQDAALPLLPVRLGAETLEIGTLRFEDVDAALAPTPGSGWRISLDSEGNSGNIILPGGNGDQSSDPIAIRLDNLDIGPLLDAPGEEAAEASGPDPRELPPLALEIESLRRGAESLGRLRLDLAHVENGLRVETFSLTGPLVTATGSGDWTRDHTDYTQTSIDVQLQSDDLGGLLRAVGSYSELDDAPSKAELALTWPGGPSGFSLARARGSMTLDAGAGRMLAVEPGVGRMLGILNLSALERRLSLDFSDVVDAGFAFDSMNGRVSIGNGQARIGRLDILAPTADIRIRGVTDLVDQTFDQTARVTPKIGTGVAIAGAVAGGPLVGAAVFLADKVSGDKVSELASYEYSITGPWSAPLVRRVAGNGAVPSLPDLLLPEQATSRGNGRPPDAAAGGSGNRNPAQDAGGERPVSPFLDAN